MKHRKWDSKTKAKVVLEGLSGMSVSEICNKNQISQYQYYIWRDKFIAESYRAFESIGNVPINKQFPDGVRPSLDVRQWESADLDNFLESLFSSLSSSDIYQLQ